MPSAANSTLIPWPGAAWPTRRSWRWTSSPPFRIHMVLAYGVSVSNPRLYFVTCPFEPSATKTRTHDNPTNRAAHHQGDIPSVANRQGVCSGGKNRLRESVADREDDQVPSMMFSETAYFFRIPWDAICARCGNTMPLRQFPCQAGFEAVSWKIPWGDRRITSQA